MTLQYYPYFKNYFKGWSDFSVGFFINSTDSDIVKADFKLVDHD